MYSKYFFWHFVFIWSGKLYFKTFHFSLTVFLEKLEIMIPQQLQENMKRKKRQKNATGRNPKIPQATLRNLKVELMMRYMSYKNVSCQELTFQSFADTFLNFYYHGKIFLVLEQNGNLFGGSVHRVIKYDDENWCSLYIYIFPQLFWLSSGGCRYRCYRKRCHSLNAQFLIMVRISSRVNKSNYGCVWCNVMWCD